jgi:hypothetical protein
VSTCSHVLVKGPHKDEPCARTEGHRGWHRPGEYLERERERCRNPEVRFRRNLLRDMRRAKYIPGELGDLT